jgi:membrane-associated phospholipid phosphatase
VLTPGRSDPAQPVHRPSSRLLLSVLGCSLAVFVAVGPLGDATQGFASPSGPATTATAGYLVLAVLVSSLLPTAERRRLVRGAGMTIAFLVGLSRIVLAVHWPTDVIAGWAPGTAVAAVTLALARLPAGSGPGLPPPTGPPR